MPEKQPAAGKPISRRHLLGLAGASAAGAAGAAAGLSGIPGLPGLPGLAASQALAAPQSQAAPIVQHFVSRPDLKVPPITVQPVPPPGTPADPRLFFLTFPYTGPGHGGAAIIDSRGELVWFGPNTAAAHKTDFNAQTLNGQPVLTWWQGQVIQGHGKGLAVIADSSYKVTHVIRVKNGLWADLHEFVITPQNTALITAYRLHSNVDLSAQGGPNPGFIYSGVFQEIDIATGNVLFEWDSYDPANPPVPLSETYFPLKSGWGTAAIPFDYFHINSVDTDASGNFIVSARHTWTIYNISKADGSINWRMNGKNSDFTMGTGSAFAWQHHVRPHGHGQLTIFDNGAAAQQAQEQQSRALILSFDTTAKQVSLVSAYTHPGTPPLLARAMGSTQVLPGGEVFVDWGSMHQFSLFHSDGTLLLGGSMPQGAFSYRGFAKPWSGHPAGLPAVAARHQAGGGATVYASWNGATGVAAWAVLAGPSAAAVSAVGKASRTGFETAVNVSNAGPYFAVHALDAAGRILARSKPVKIV